jgi:hypothetical protein
MSKKITVKCMAKCLFVPTEHTFEFLLRKAEKPEELSIFKRWYNKHMNPFGFSLEFPHHEIQILSDTSSYGELHVHKGDRGEGKGKNFICYVRTVSTESKVEELVKNWCVGALIKKYYQLELNLVMKEVKDGDLMRYAKENFEIELSSFRIG